MIEVGITISREEAFLNGNPDELKNWDKICVTLQDSASLATNGIPINENVFITDPEFKFIGDEIEKRNIKVEYVDFPITRSFGVSFRCNTHPLLRSDN